MTDERDDRAFREHPTFERTAPGEFAVTSTPFETGVTPVADGASRVVVRTPTLDAVVEDETVAEVVADGWFETLERRLADVHAVTEADVTPPAVERRDGEVVVTVEVESTDPERAAEDALAVAEYVEGTWVQGIVPGYDYREPAAGLLARATREYDGGAGGPGGNADPTP